MEIKELKQLIKMAKKEGLIRVKFNGIELDFKESVVGPKPKPLSPEEMEEQIQTQKQSEMDALLWSVTDLDPLRDLDAQDNA